MKTSLLPVLMMALALAAHTQETEPTPTSGGDSAAAPATLAGQRSPRGLSAEHVTPNYLTGGIDITQMYTDNAELATNNQISDLSCTIQPRIALNHATPRLTYSLGAVAGFIVNRTLDERNQATQSVSLDLSYGVSRFTTLRLSESFMNTTGLWSGPETGSAATAGGGGVGVIQEPNRALFTFGRFMTNTLLAELSRQFTLRGSGGVRGIYSTTWFPESATAAELSPLYGGQTYTAEVFYNYRLTTRHWLGVNLRGQRFDMEGPAGRTDTVSLLFLYAFNLRPNVSLSFFAGPELSTTALPSGVPPPDVSFPRRMWSPATGAVFTWQGRKTGATATFVRQVSNGAGLSSAVTLTGVDGELRRQLTRRLEAAVGFAYTRSVPISLAETIRTYSARAELTHRLTRNCALRGGYARDDNSYLDSNATALANRFWLSFSYDFSRPLR